MYKVCPECKKEIPQKAEVCFECSCRIVGTECGKCKSICKTDAVICKWCLNPLKTKYNKEKLYFNSFEIKSELIPTVLFGMSFLCQTALFTKEKIVIKTPYSFGLVSKTEEVMWNKVTGFQHHSGIIWDNITIETRGQTTNNISFLSKNDARKIIDVLREFQD